MSSTPAPGHFRGASLRGTEETTPRWRAFYPLCVDTLLQAPGSQLSFERPESTGCNFNEL